MTTATFADKLRWTSLCCLALSATTGPAKLGDLVVGLGCTVLLIKIVQRALVSRRTWRAFCREPTPVVRSGANGKQVTFLTTDRLRKQYWCDGNTLADDVYELQVANLQPLLDSQWTWQDLQALFQEQQKRTVILWIGTDIFLTWGDGSSDQEFDNGYDTFGIKMFDKCHMRGDLKIYSLYLEQEKAALRQVFKLLTTTPRDENSSFNRVQLVGQAKPRPYAFGNDPRGPLDHEPDDRHFRCRLPLKADTLYNVLQCSNLETFEFVDLYLDWKQSRMLTHAVPPTLHVVLDNCSFQDGGEALVTAIGNNKGPTKLTFKRNIPLNLRRSSSQQFQRLLEILPTNTSLTLLGLHQVDFQSHDYDVSLFDDYHMSLFAFLMAVQANKCLQHLSLRDVTLGHHHWFQIVRILQTHKSLKSMDLIRTGRRDTMLELFIPAPRSMHGMRSFENGLPVLRHEMFRDTGFWISSADKNERTRDVERALETNTTLTKIAFLPCDLNTKRMVRHVLPRLQVNQYRDGIQAIAREPDTDVRRHALKRALAQLSSSYYTTAPLYMLVKENADVISEVFPKEEK